MDGKSIIKVPRREIDVVITCDPAISEKVSADRTAIVAVGMTTFHKMIVLDYWVGRQGDPARIIEKMLDMAYQWQPRIIGVESVAYQAAIEPYLKREMVNRNVFYPFTSLKPDRNERKEQRILSMQPFFRAGQIYVQRGMFDLIEEFETFPLGRTKDILDALAYALRLLAPKQAEAKPGLHERLKLLQRDDPSSARYWRSWARKQGNLEPEETIDEIMDGDGVTEERFEVGVGDIY